MPSVLIPIVRNATDLTREVEENARRCETFRTHCEASARGHGDVLQQHCVGWIVRLPNRSTRTLAAADIRQMSAVFDVRS